jgi:mannose-1-phosphate guanylyltransferase
VVLNGDVLTDLDLTDMIRFHRARGARATIYLTPVEDPSAYGLVDTDADGRIRGFVEKPRREQITATTINAGVYLLESGLLDLIPSGHVVSMERDVFPDLVARGIPFFGYVSRAYWLDIGSPETYRRAHVDLLRGAVATPLSPPGTRTGDVWVGRGVTMHPSAVVSGPAVLGAGVTLEAQVEVGPFTVLGDGVTVGRGSRLEASVLWEEVRVAAGAVVRQCVIGARARIEPGVHVAPGTVVADNQVVT